MHPPSQIYNSQDDELCRVKKRNEQAVRELDQNGEDRLKVDEGSRYTNQ